MNTINIKPAVLALLITTSILSCSPAQTDPIAKNVDVNTFKELIDSRNGILIDVRRPDEFETGHIEGARLINVEDPGFETEISKLDRDSDIYLYCRSGGRSGRAMEKMAEMGFKKLYNLEGGYMKWSE